MPHAHVRVESFRRLKNKDNRNDVEHLLINSSTPPVYVHRRPNTATINQNNPTTQLEKKKHNIQNKRKPLQHQTIAPRKRCGKKAGLCYLNLLPLFLCSFFLGLLTPWAHQYSLNHMTVYMMHFSQHPKKNKDNI